MTAKIIPFPIHRKPETSIDWLLGPETATERENRLFALLAHRIAVNWQRGLRGQELTEAVIAAAVERGFPEDEVTPSLYNEAGAHAWMVLGNAGAPV